MRQWLLVGVGVGVGGVRGEYKRALLLGSPQTDDQKCLRKRPFL